MLKLEKQLALFKCKFCSGIYRDPVSLPCGASICKVHSQTINQTNCFGFGFCSEIHTVPENGFPPNDELEAKIGNCF